MHDCLQTTAEREYVSRGNLITQRQSHGASCCEWVHSGREKTLAWLQFGSSSIPCNLHEHDVLLQFMAPLSVIFLKSISALNMISLRLTVIIENRVIDTVMWCISFGLYDTRPFPIMPFPQPKHTYRPSPTVPLSSVSLWSLLVMETNTVSGMENRAK